MRILRLTVLMALVVAASCLDSVPILIPRAVGDENSAQRNALDPHLKPLIGKWQGRVHSRSSKAGWHARTLVIEEKAGQLVARYGGKQLDAVNLSVEIVESRLKVSFRTDDGKANITLYLVVETRRPDFLCELSADPETPQRIGMTPHGARVVVYVKGGRVEARTSLIGYFLLPPLAGKPSAERQAFLQGLHEIGYYDGRNIAIETDRPPGIVNCCRSSRPNLNSG